MTECSGYGMRGEHYWLDGEWSMYVMKECTQFKPMKGMRAKAKSKNMEKTHTFICFG